MNHYKQFKVGRCVVRISQDEDAENPRGWRDDVFIVAKHDQFYVPEPGEDRCPDGPEELLERYVKTHWIFPLEAYIHSGVRLAFSREGNFPDRRWDVSQLGFVFVRKKEWRLRKSARKAAASVIEAWNQYLSGDVWRYEIFKDSDDINENDVLDTYWGMYGLEYCEENAREQAEAISKVIEKVDLETATAATMP
jgi:hypothetical protein